ncbi:MAG: CarD family transcriptional regulator [Lachnospiraceae bacterium]
MTGESKMYQVGELIVYGGTGVCRVEAVETPQQRGPEAGRQYYLLKPLYQDGTIRIPVDSKVFMRPVISRQEAEALLDAIPGMHAEACHERNFTQLAARFMKRAPRPCSTASSP